MQFYDVKHKKPVEVPDDKITKRTYDVKGRDGQVRVRYAAQAEMEVEGSMVKMTKFINKETFDSMSAPVKM
ncbi:MAG: hypothetical protein HY459_01595 [Parcubacteria group bacterium]|nr:hypothetical protein [Parcubacteria group bacterium]